MNGCVARAILLASASWLFVPASVFAGHHASCETPACGPTAVGCFTWKLEECEETVYTVTYKEEVKKVKRPVIKEIKRPVTIKVCKPFDRTVVRDCLVPEYKQDFKTIDAVIHRTITDECGNCTHETECQKELQSCLIKNMVPVGVSFLEWELIPVEHTYNETYLVQEWEEQEVVVRTPVRTPKTIVTKIWKKVPVCPCPIEGCVDGACGVTH